MHPGPQSLPPPAGAAWDGRLRASGAALATPGSAISLSDSTAHQAGGPPALASSL